MSAASGAVVYQGRILTVKEFLENELRIGIERYDLNDYGERELTQTHFEQDPESATEYLFRQLEIDKCVPKNERPKYKLIYADKYGNHIW